MRRTTRKEQPGPPVDPTSAPAVSSVQSGADEPGYRDRRPSTFVAQFRRYLVVGGAAWVVDVSILFLLTEMAGAYSVLSATIAFAAGLLLNYALSVAWVFDRRALANRQAEFSIFSMIGAGGIGLNALIIWSLTEFVLPHYLLAKVVSSGVVLWWNFLAKKYILFR